MTAVCDQSRATNPALGESGSSHILNILIHLKKSITSCQKKQSSRASRTVLPVAWVSLTIMVSTESITSVVPVTAICCVGKQNIFAFVIANPLTTTFCFRQFLCFPAQPALWPAFGSIPFPYLGFCFSPHIHPFSSTRFLLACLRGKKNIYCT